MKKRSPTQTNSFPKSSFSPVHPGLLQRKCGCGKSTEAPQVLHEVLPLSSPNAQPKLKIGQPNDKYEQEADRVANQVMQMPEPQVKRQMESEEEDETLQTKPIAGQISPLIQRQMGPEEEAEEEAEEKDLVQTKADSQIQRQEATAEEREEEEEPLQTKRASNSPSSITPAIQSGIQALRQSSGQPLPANVQTFMEPRFGQDFSGVRLHTTGQVSQLAHTLNARAFTVGSDVVFGAGQFQPHTAEGRKLLAHELTHTIQQSRSSRAKQQPIQLQRKNLSKKEHNHQHLLRFLNRVKGRILTRAQKGRRILITKGRSKKAAKILNLNKKRDPEFKDIAANTKNLLAQLFELGQEMSEGRLRLRHLKKFDDEDKKADDEDKKFDDEDKKVGSTIFMEVNAEMKMDPDQIALGRICCSDLSYWFKYPQASAEQEEKSVSTLRWWPSGGEDEAKKEQANFTSGFSFHSMTKPCNPSDVNLATGKNIFCPKGFPFPADASDTHNYSLNVHPGSMAVTQAKKHDPTFDIQTSNWELTERGDFAVIWSDQEGKHKRPFTFLVNAKKEGKTIEGGVRFYKGIDRVNPRS